MTPSTIAVQQHVASLIHRENVPGFVAHFRATHPGIAEFRDLPAPHNVQKEGAASHPVQPYGNIMSAVLSTPGEFKPSDLVGKMTLSQAQSNCRSLFKRGVLDRMRIGNKGGSGEEPVYRVRKV